MPLYSICIIRSERENKRVIEELEAEFAPLSRYDGELPEKRSGCVATLFALVQRLTDRIASARDSHGKTTNPWTLHSPLFRILLEVLSNVHDASVGETVDPEVVRDRISVRIRWCIDRRGQRVCVLVRDTWAGTEAAMTQWKRERPWTYLGGEGKWEAYCECMTGGRYSKKIFKAGASVRFILDRYPDTEAEDIQER